MTINWKQIDWTQRSTDLATQLGKSISTVSLHRRKYAPHTLRDMGNTPRSVMASIGKPLALPATVSGPKTYTLGKAREFQIPDLYVHLGDGERVKVSRLAGEHGNVPVSITPADFMDAWQGKGQAILAGLR